MSEKKLVGKFVAVALGIVCIVLAVGLVGTFAYCMLQINQKENTIADLNNEIDSLNSQITTKRNMILSLASQVSSLNSQISDQNNTISCLNNQIVDLQSQVDNLHIWGTESSTVLVNHETGIESNISRAWNLGNLSVAGYISVLVSSNNTSTNVGFYFTSNGTDYAYQTAVGLGGIAVFPVLPTSIMTTVIVGNSFGETSIYTVTITYYY